MPRDAMQNYSLQYIFYALPSPVLNYSNDSTFFHHSPGRLSKTNRLHCEEILPASQFSFLNFFPFFLVTLSETIPSFLFTTFNPSGCNPPSSKTSSGHAVNIYFNLSISVAPYLLPSTFPWQVHL